MESKLALPLNKDHNEKLWKAFVDLRKSHNVQESKAETRFLLRAEKLVDENAGETEWIDRATNTKLTYVNNLNEDKENFNTDDDDVSKCR